MRLRQLADQLGIELVGSKGSTDIIGVATLTQATPQHLSFYTNRSYRKQLAQTQAAAVLLHPKDQDSCPVPQLLSDNPYLTYARVAALFAPSTPNTTGIHPSAIVSADVRLGANVSIGAHAVIEAQADLADAVHIGAGCVVEREVSIGAHCCLYANVTLCRGTRLGQRVVVHPGAVIGADGFGLANDRGQWVKIPQLGGVIIGDDCDIGANTTIDRGALDDTVIGNGVKLDNQIQVGHNVTIGQHTAVAGCVGIAGSTQIGEYCMIGGGVGVGGHLTIADHVHITGGSLIMQSIPEAGVYSSGGPLEPNAQWHRNYHRMKQLDDIAKRLKHLEQQFQAKNIKE